MSQKNIFLKPKKT